MNRTKWMTHHLVGVVLFLSTATLHAQRWSLHEDVRIGTQDGPDALTLVTALAVDDEGRLYVAQPMDARIVVFDSGGGSLTSLGREGDGPGEFRAPLQMGWVRDSLWVYDPPAGRVSFWRDREYTGSLPFRGVDMGPDYRRASLVALLADGGALATAAPVQHRSARHPESRGAVLRTDRRGENASPVTTLRFTPPTTIQGEGSRMMLAYQPFDDGTLLAVSPDGERIVVVEREAARNGRRAIFSLLVLAAGGDTLADARIPYRPQALNEEMINRVVEVPDARIASRFPSPAAARRAIRQAVYLPAYQPPVTDVVVGRDHTVWLRREHTGTSTVEWTVLDERGGTLGRLNIPSAAKVFQADLEHVWTVEHDELEIPYVCRYRVER